MRAVLIPQHGGLEVLTYTRDAPEPQLREDEVLLQVEFTGINYVDTLVRQGYPGITIPLPHIPGGDIVGQVVELGKGVAQDWKGRRVVVYPVVWCGECPYCKEGKVNLCLNWRFFGLHRWGGYAERVAVPVRNLIPLPGGVIGEEAAALPVAGLTAYHALVTVGQLKRGEVFLTWGGAGGVGTIAIQIAHHLGSKVVAIGSTPQRLELMKRLGAELVINRREEEVIPRVMEHFPYGVDLILDFGGTETFPQSFQMVKKGGRIVLCGIITGREVSPFSIHQTYLRHLSILGIYLGLPAELEELVRWVARGWIKPVVGAVFPLKEAARGQEALTRGEILGKGVIGIAEQP